MMIGTGVGRPPLASATPTVLHTPLCDLLGIGNAPCGQTAGLIREIRPAGEVVAAIVEEAESLLARLRGP